MTIGEKIKTKRRELDLTYEQVANVCGVSKTTVRAWELGISTNIKSDKIALLSQALHVQPLYFLDCDIKQDPYENISDLQKEMFDKILKMNIQQQVDIYTYINKVMDR